MAHGGTVVRPGAVAWGAAPGTPEGAYSSCEAVEQVLAAVVKDADRLTDLLDELARARVWIPLPGGKRPVIDGSSVALPTVTYLGAEFVPCFTSVQRLGIWPATLAAGPAAGDRASGEQDPGSPRPGGQVTDGRVPHARAGDDHNADDRLDGAGDRVGSGDRLGGAAGLHWRRAAEPPVTPHIVVPAAALARQLPPGLGIALNPGAEASVPVYPEGVALLGATENTGADGRPIRVGHPPSEPEALLNEVRSRLHALPAVRAAARAWLSVPGRGAGLIISVTLDDPASTAAHEAVVGTIEGAVATIPQQAPFPIDVTFPGEAEPDLVDDWVAKNTSPFYVRG
jgi:hypothetical protein